MAGVLVLVLTGPVVALLAVTVIGIAVLPVLLGALLIAWIVGKVAVNRWIGTRLFEQDDPESRLESTRSFVIGFVVITIAYMIPLLGIVVWGLTRRARPRRGDAGVRARLSTREPARRASAARDAAGAAAAGAALALRSRGARCHAGRGRGCLRAGAMRICRCTDRRSASPSRCRHRRLLATCRRRRRRPTARPSTRVRCLPTRAPASASALPRSRSTSCWSRC